MYLRVFCQRYAAALLLALPVAALAGDPSPTPPHEDYSKYKSADDLWNNYQVPRGGDKADYLSKQVAECDEMIRRFPDDLLTWNARFTKIDALVQLTKLGKPGLSVEQGVAQCLALANGPHASADINDAGRTKALQLLAGDGPVETLTKEMRSYLHDYPNMATNHLDETIIKQAKGKLGNSDPEVTQQLDKCLADIDAARVKRWPDQVAAQKAKMDAPPHNGSSRVQITVLPKLEGKPFDFKFTALDGTEVDGATLRGKVVLIDYWATWCGPCMEQMPEVVAAYQKYHDRGLEVIGVSLDEGDEAAIKGKLPRFTKDRGMVWPQACDGRGWQGELVKRVGIHFIPMHFLVNKQGVVLVDENLGVPLNEEVEKLLAE